MFSELINSTAPLRLKEQDFEIEEMMSIDFPKEFTQTIKIESKQSEI